MDSSTVLIDQQYTDPCASGPIQETSTITYSFTFGGDTNEFSIERDISQSVDCDSGATTTSPVTTTTNNAGSTDQPYPWALTFGCSSSTEFIPGYLGTETANWDGNITFQCPWYYSPNTPVIFTFFNVGYTTADAVDLSQVTFQGNAPIAWDNTNYTVSYLLSVSPGEGITIGSGSFAWPAGYCSVTDNPDDPFPYQTADDNQFSFDGFGNTVMPSNIVHVTFATIPSNTGRTTIGVGEEVYFNLSPGCPCGNTTWSVTGASNYGASGNGGFFYADGQQSEVNITAVCCGKTYSASFNVIEPTGIENVYISSTGVPAYSVGTAGASMELGLTMAPTSVSFYQVQEGEVTNAASSVFGYFTNFPAALLAHTSAGFFVQVNQANQWSDGCNTGTYVLPSPFSSGGFQWVIPWRWFVPGWSTNTMSPYTQTFTIDANGTMSISKLGQTVTRTTNNVITPEVP